MKYCLGAGQQSPPVPLSLYRRRTEGLLKISTVLFILASRDFYILLVDQLLFHYSVQAKSQGV